MLEQKITADQAASTGCIDALYIFHHRNEFDRRSYKTAIQHINRYKFAKKFVKAKKIIDAACGVGYGKKIIQQNNYQHYFGIDISDENTKLAEKNYADTNSDFICSDVTKIENTKKFNNTELFISFETIEHLKNYDEFLKFIHSVLKPNGKLLISTPNREITNPGKKFNEGTKWEYHEQEWILPEFVQLLEKHKFNVKRIYGQSYYLNLKIARLIPYSHASIKKITQRVLPYFPRLNFLIKPNFYIVYCEKVK